MSSKSLGALTLDLIAKTGGWVEGMSKADRATAELERKTAARQKAMMAKWKGYGTGIAAGFAAIGGAGLFLKFIEETKQAQMEQAQLAAVLKSTANAAGYSQEKLNAMAASMSGASNFDDGQITEAQTRLLSYTGVVGDVFPRAMQNAIDMAQRMGMDVSQAAETVGKALDVPSQGMSALSKQGFRFTDAQKELVKKLEETGKAAEAQAIVLEAMEGSYKGAAAAARDTLGGAIADLQKSFKDLMTGDDGSANGVKESIQELAKTMRSEGVKQGFAAIGAGLVTIAEKAASAIGFLNNFGIVLGQTVAKWAGGSDEPAQRLRDQAAELEAEAKRLNSNKVAPIIERMLFGGEQKAADAAKKAAALRYQAFEYERNFKEHLPPATKTDTAPDLEVKTPTPTGGDSKSSDKAAKDAAREAAALARASFQSYLAEIKRQTGAQIDALDDRQARLDLQQDQGLLSIAAFYGERTAIEQQALAAKLQGVDAEIAAQQKFMAAAGKDTERVDAQSKLNDLYEERNKLQRAGALEAEKLGVAEAKAMKDLSTAAEDVRVRLLEMNGQLGEAARLRADMGNIEQIARFELNGFGDAANGLRQLADYEAAQGRLNELKREFGLINESLGIAQDRISLAQQSGAAGEIEALDMLGQVRRQAIAQLEKQLALYLATNAAASTPEVALAIERMKVELEDLKLVAAPLAQQFQDIFEGSFGDAFSGIVSGAKIAKDAFTDMADSIVQQISRMAAQQIASSIFGKDGAGSGLGSLVAGFFGGGSSPAPKLPGFAIGSSYIAKDQVAMLHKGERVLTAQENRDFAAGGGAMVVNNNFTVQGNPTRQTQLQISSAAAAGLARAQRRNG